MTVEVSEGWTYDQSRSEEFGRGESRRVRVKDSEEYLIWQAAGA